MKYHIMNYGRMRLAAGSVYTLMQTQLDGLRYTLCPHLSQLVAILAQGIMIFFSSVPLTRKDFLIEYFFKKSWGWRFVFAVYYRSIWMMRNWRFPSQKSLKFEGICTNSSLTQAPETTPFMYCMTSYNQAVWTERDFRRVSLETHCGSWLQNHTSDQCSV